MKAMKRFLSLAMVCLLLCGLLPGFAYADDPAVGTIALSNASGNAGDTVTTIISIRLKKSRISSFPADIRSVRKLLKAIDPQSVVIKDRKIRPLERHQVGI